LRALPDGHDLPWWRVVNARGAVSDRPVVYAKPLQQKLLRKEGLRFDKSGCASWEKYGWNGPAEKSSDDRGGNRKNARHKTRDH
jgi:methylated-DNA-protein-cysteine methyltransferase-like protein